MGGRILGASGLFYGHGFREISLSIRPFLNKGQECHFLSGYLLLVTRGGWHCVEVIESGITLREAFNFTLSCVVNQVMSVMKSRRNFFKKFKIQSKDFK